MKPDAHITNANSVTTLLLEMVPLTPSDNILVRKFIYNSGCGAGGGANLPPKPATGAGAASKLAPNPLDTGAEKPDVEGTLGVKDDGSFFGAGDTGVGLFAASSAFALRSLSLPANMIPDRVPVKNVAIGIINSKNFWSIGEIAFNGCVTKIIEYRTTKTIPVNVHAKQIPMKNFRRAINCSSVYITLLFSTVSSLSWCNTLCLCW